MLVNAETAPACARTIALCVFFTVASWVNQSTLASDVRDSAPQAVSGEADATATDQLLSKLSSDRYVQRRSAFLSLWKGGAPYLDSIKAAAQGGDPQFRQTLRLLVALIELEIAPGDDGMLETVVQYLAKPTPEAVYGLCEQDNWKLARQLILRSPALRQQMMGQSGQYQVRRIVRLAVAADSLVEAWSVLETLLPSELVCLLAQRLDVQVSAEVAGEVSDSVKNFFANDFEALVSLKAAWRTKLPWVARAGEWSALADEELYQQLGPTIGSDKVAELIRILLLDFSGDFAGSQRAWGKLVQSLLKGESQGPIQDARAASLELLEEAGAARPMAIFALLCHGEMGAIADYMAQAGQKNVAFTVYSSIGEYSKALQVIGLEDLSDFDSWLERRLSLLAKESRGEEIEFDTTLRACRLLTNLGAKEQSGKLLKMLAGVISVKTKAFSRSQKTNLERYLWGLIVSRMSSSDDGRQMVLELVRDDYPRLTTPLRDLILGYLFEDMDQCATQLLETSNSNTRTRSSPNASAWAKLELLWQLDRSGLEALFEQESSGTDNVQAWLKRGFARTRETRSEATFQMAQLALGLGMPDLALEFCRTPGAGVGEHLGEAGRILASQGRAAEALRYFESVRQYGIAQYAQQETAILLQEGRFDDAEKLQVVRWLLPLLAWPGSNVGQGSVSSAYQALGRKFLQDGNQNEAAAHFQAAFLLSPPYRSESYIIADSLARSLEELGRFQQSADVRRASLVELLHGNSNISQIMSTPQMTINYLPAMKQTAVHERLERAAVLLQGGEVDEALHHIDFALRIDPRNIEIAIQTVPLLGEANLHHADRIFETIDEAMLSVLEEWPKHSYTLNNLAWMYAKCGRKLPKALELVTRAVLVSPDSATYLDTLAEVQFQQGDVDAAIETARKCVRLDPREQHYRENVVRFRAARSKH